MRSGAPARPSIEPNRRVRLDPDQVETLIASAPPTFELHARNPERDIVFGGSNLVFGAVGGPAFVSDLDRGRRAGNFADFVDYVRLIGALDVIHQEGGGPLEPNDLPVETRHLDMYRTFAVELDKTWQCLGFGARPVQDALEVACLIRGVTRDDLLREPSLMTVINTNSPLRLDGPMGDGLMEMALHGQPVVATPFTLAGAMSPVSLAGALAQQNAEALFLVALSQIVRPGAPMVYGAFTSNVDMRTGAPAFGTPESVKGALASGQLARRYRPPVAVVERHGLQRGRRPGGLRIGDGRLGRGDGRRQPALPGRGLARGRADRVVREADHRRRDPPDDVRGPPAAAGRRGQPRLRGDRSTSGRAAISSARRIRSNATRRRSTGRSSRIGATSRRGRRTGPGPRRSAPTPSGSDCWPRRHRRHLDPPILEALDAFVARRKREIERAD